MVASQIRAQARETLTGKWGKSALISLSYIGVEFLIAFLVNLLTNIPFIGLFVSIANIIISIPISYGIITTFIRLRRGEEVGYFDFLTTAFNSIGKVWGVVGNMLLKLLPYIIVIIVSIVCLATSGVGLIVSNSLSSSSSSFGAFGILALVSIIALAITYIALIPKTFSFALVFYLLFDNESMTGKQIVQESVRLMNGNRWSLFWLHFTFLGWALLACFTLGIGFLFLLPYIFVSIVIFYESLRETPEEKNENVTPISDNN